jgi:hypothetical protein
MQYKKLSLEIIRQELLKVQAEIIKDNATGEKYLLPSRISQETKQLYRIIGIKCKSFDPTVQSPVFRYTPTVGLN